jgi:DNA (cytosine-5)-methyltransferase 1
MSRVVKIVDLFAGAGGTSDGALHAISAMGMRADLTAINHWPVAVATHQVNHPEARVLCTGVDAVNPRELFAPGGLDLLWASPECTHHSIARGGRPINDQSRATAWCVVRWAEAVRPPVILVENVPEFLTWGPCGTNGRPLSRQKGATFHAWVGALRSLGYQVDWRVLCAADYGDPTTRKRLFVQAVCGRRRVVWPEPTHGEALEDDFFAARRPWVPARDIIDWSLVGQSIYDRARPLSPKTMARIEAGLKKYGLRPFVAAWDHQSGSGVWSGEAPLSTVTTKARHGVVEPFLVEMRGTDVSQVNSSGRDLSQPLGTVTAGGNHHALIEPALLGQQSGSALRPVSQPAPTVATAGAIALVEPFLVKFYGTGGAQSTGQPLDTVTTKDRHALVNPEVVVDGQIYKLDIRFRMLQPHELAAAQGFRRDYVFTGSKADQVKQIGNAVPRGLASALVGAAMTQRAEVGWLSDAA